MEQQKQNWEQRKDLEEFAGMYFKGLASDVTENQCNNLVNP